MHKTKLPHKLILVLLLVIPCSLNLLAGFTDYTIQADQSRYDNQQGIAHFFGHVEATHGDEHIRSNEMTVFLNKKNQVTQLLCLGNPAYYDFLSADPKKQLHAKAKQIRYKQKISFIQNATIRRGKNSISAEWIDYWPDTNILKTYDNPSKKQTHIILQANEMSL
jgi:lipopolysaccharide transport protein LptA